MTSECSSCTCSIGESLSSLDQSPFHTPDVNGCSAPASRAHANTCGSSFRTRSTLLLVLAAVAVRVHVVVHSRRPSRARASPCRTRATTPVTYVLSRGYCSDPAGLRAGSLQPAGVVDARFPIVLLAELRIGIPARIEEHEQRFDLVLRGDVEELIDSRLDNPCVLLPRQIMQKHSHRRHAEPFGPAELLVDRVGSNVSACHISSSLIALPECSCCRPAMAASHTTRWPSPRTSGPSGACARASVQTQPIRNAMTRRNIFMAQTLA